MHDSHTCFVLRLLAIVTVIPTTYRLWLLACAALLLRKTRYRRPGTLSKGTSEYKLMRGCTDGWACMVEVVRCIPVAASGDPLLVLKGCGGMHSENNEGTDGQSDKREPTAAQLAILPILAYGQRRSYIEHDLLRFASQLYGWYPEISAFEFRHIAI